MTVSVFIRHDRHDCARKGGKSVFLELKEHYAFSPVYVVADGVATEQDDPEVLAAISRDSGAQFVSSGRFGWIWTQGRCPACGLTARSAAGRLVDPQIRPPAEHAIIR